MRGWRCVISVWGCSSAVRQLLPMRQALAANSIVPDWTVRWPVWICPAWQLTRGRTGSVQVRRPCSLLQNLPSGLPHVPLHPVRPISCVKPGRAGAKPTAMVMFRWLAWCASISARMISGSPSGPIPLQSKPAHSKSTSSQADLLCCGASPSDPVCVFASPENMLQGKPDSGKLCSRVLRFPE